MGFSGVLLNHPRLIAGFSVPGWLIPGHYHLRNWNRSSLIKMVFSQRRPETGFLCGKQGVWQTDDGARTFQPLKDGFPDSRFYGKTNDILLIERGSSSLLAGTDGGLYACDPAVGKWRKIALDEETERVVKILAVEDKIVAFTPSHAYVSPADLRFTPLPLPRDPPQHRVSWIRLVFELHSGAIWGTGGRLIYDLAGVALIFLSASGLYLWYFPRRRKPKDRPAGKSAGMKVFKSFYRYHLKLGIYFAPVLLFIGFTGLLMRPPLLAVLQGSFDSSYYPGFCGDNSWEEKIHNALYHPARKQIIIEAADGIWAAPSDLGRPFVEIKLPVPVFVMGSTVFEADGAGILVGSFNGIFRIDLESGKAACLLTAREAVNVSPVRPADFMVTGYVKTPAGEELVAGHQQGLLALEGVDMAGRFAMPHEMDKRMPLWNYLFELHNGRIFQGWIGKWYILIAPLGSLLFILVTLSGVLDWYRRKNKQ